MSRRKREARSESFPYSPLRAKGKMNNLHRTSGTFSLTAHEQFSSFSSSWTFTTDSVMATQDEILFDVLVSENLEGMQVGYTKRSICPCEGRATKTVRSQLWLCLCHCLRPCASWGNRDLQERGLFLPGSAPRERSVIAPSGMHSPSLLRNRQITILLSRFSRKLDQG